MRQAVARVPRQALWLAAFAMAGILLLSQGATATGKQTLTGEVSDAACGAHHTMMPGPPAECTRACVKNGAKYTLIVDGKTYVLNTTDKGILTLLDRQAGSNVTVTGSVNGVAVQVETAVAAP
jgi:hypothetical protein